MGMAEFGVPLILGGLGAAGSALSGGAEGRIGSFGRGSLAPTRRDLDPTMLGRSVAPIESLLAALAGRVSQPYTAPAAVVQPPPMFQGGGLPMPIGTTGVDPALQRPGLLGTPGLNFGDRGYFSGAYNPGRGTRQYSDLGMQNLGRIQQTPPDVPEVGAGLPQMQSAMELLGVHSDPMGNLFMDQTGLFTGANQGEDGVNDHSPEADPERPDPSGDPQPTDPSSPCGPGYEYDWTLERCIKSDDPCPGPHWEYDGVGCRDV